MFHQGERRFFGLYADEYQRFSTSTFGELLAEARKFGIGTVLAHQDRNQLEVPDRSSPLRGWNLVVFQVQGSDADELAHAFDRTPPPPQVAGERPVMAPSNRPLDYLERHGTNDPHIARAVRQPRAVLH